MKYSVKIKFGTAYFTALLSVFVLLSVSCMNGKLKSAQLRIQTKTGAEHIVSAEIAVTQEEQSRGYMFRKKIPDSTGMLFVFEYDKQASFWMKNTLVPLSIAYIDSRGKIRDIFDMTPQSLAPVRSTVSVRYALEVPAGWFDRSGISVGDTVVIPDFRALE